MEDTITFTKAKLREFKKVYNKAKIGADDHKVFMFEGRSVLLSYAKYIIEFLESEFKDK